MKTLVCFVAVLGICATGAAGQPRLDALPAAVRADVERAFAAVRDRPDDPAVVGRLAMLLHAYEQHRDAAERYRALRRLEPASATWAYLSGVVAAALGEHATAIAAFRDAVRIDGDHLAARVRLAQALLDRGDLDAAGDEWDRLARELPELALAHYGLGRVATARGDARSALERFQRAIDLSPEFGAAHYALAMAARDLGASDRIAAHLEAYRRHGMRQPALRDPVLDQVRAMRTTARDLLAAAARLGAANRIEEAIALQLDALALDPKTGQAHVNLISLYGRTGRVDDATRHYEAALALGSSVPDAHYNYGVLLASGRRDDEAADAFRRALEADPFHAASHHNLAGLLARRQRYAEAAIHYRQALANDPQHETARVNLGRVLALLGRTAEAADVLRQALARAERIGRKELINAIRTELERVEAKR